MSLILFVSAAVGVIDGGMAITPNINNVEVHIVGNKSAPTANTDSGKSHASYVIKMISKGYKPTKEDTLKIYYGSPFHGIDVDNKSHAMGVDWNKMTNLLIEFKKNGVKYVCTTFVTGNKAKSLAFLNKAKELDLIIVTSLGNNEMQEPYPAMHENTISVLDRNIPNAKLAKKATYHIDGEVKIGTKVITFGSSFAAAKITGMLAKN